MERTREAASGDETDALVNARCIVSEVLKNVLGNRSKRSSAGYQGRLGGREAWKGRMQREWRKRKFGVDAQDRAEKNSPGSNGLARAPCPLSPVGASATRITWEFVSGTIGTPHPRFKKGHPFAG